MTVTAPIVNMNGTSAEQLLDGYEAAYRALRELQNAMSAITPHGRDYQTVDPGIYERAREEHAMRLVAINKIEREIIELAQAVQHQQREREAIRNRVIQ